MAQKSRRNRGFKLPTFSTQSYCDEDRRTLIIVALSLPIVILIAVVVIADACTR